MKVARLSWTSFCLPLRMPFRTARGRITQRQGIVLRLITDTGVAGLGETSPHPALGPEAVRGMEAVLEWLAPRLVGVDLECQPALPEDGIPAPVACALDTAALDALARARGISVACLLSKSARAGVPVNATIGAETDAEAASEATAAREAGFRSVKLKVGTAHSLDDERRRVAAAREALGPDVGLRLDANGAWTVEQAVRAIRSMAEFGLELVEQPIAPGDLEGMARVRSRVDVPIAADEDVTDLQTAERLLEAGAADILVVKPMALGGLRPALRIIEMATSARIPVIVTTTIDSGIGTAAALHLAATLPADAPACGLATGSLLAADLIAQPLAAKRGRMNLPDGAGLGVELDERALGLYGGAEREVA